MNVEIRGDRESSSDIVVLVTVTARELDALQKLATKPLPKVLAKTHPAFDILVQPNFALWAEADDGTVILAIAEEFPAAERDRSHRTSKRAEKPEPGTEPANG
jgi:hypothetical protein